jgi:hypothetical protein
VSIPSDDIDAFIGYFDRLYADHPEATASRRGARDDEIEKLVRLAGRPLPALYLGYLQVFGRRDGALKLGYDASCSAPHVLRHHRRCARSECPAAPRGCVLISNRGLSFSRALHYHAAGTEPRVVTNDDGHITETVARSFGVYLYREAWQRRWLRGDAARFGGLRSGALPDVARVAEALGFESQWFSDEYRYCAERVAARIVGYPAHDGTVSVTVIADAPAEQASLAAILVQALRTEW